METFWTGFEKRAINLNPTPMWDQLSEMKGANAMLFGMKNKDKLIKEFVEDERVFQKELSMSEPPSYGLRSITSGGIGAGLGAGIAALMTRKFKAKPTLIGGAIGAGLGALSAKIKEENISTAKDFHGLLGSKQTEILNTKAEEELADTMNFLSTSY